MKQKLFVLSLALSLVFRSHAQAPTSGFVPLTHADTARAVHRIFSKHRVGGIVWTSIGAAFTVQILAAAASGPGNASGAGAGVVVFGGIPAGIGLGKLLRFGVGREKTVLDSYDFGQPLPHYIRRRLKKTKYFMR